MLLTLRETAEYLKVSVRTVHRLIRDAGLPSFKVGGQWRVRADELQRWLQAKKEEATASLEGWSVDEIRRTIEDLRKREERDV